MTFLKKWLIAALTASALLLGAGNASANFTASGAYGTHGYSVINLNTTGGLVDFVFNFGYGDATFSLFNSAGAHLISNDDSNSLRPHLTRNLGEGNYSLLVSYCCSFITPVQNAGGASFSSTDGFNSGSYWLGGSATLASVEAYLDSATNNFQSTYNVSVSNAEQGTSSVPEPGSLALMGLAIVVLALRRQQRNV